MQGVTEAAAFIDRPDALTGTDLLLHPLHQPGDGEAQSGLGMLMVVLDGGGDLFEVHVQAQFEQGFDLGIVLDCDLCSVVHVMIGLMVDIDLTLNGVLVLHTLVNPSWHLTPINREQAADQPRMLSGLPLEFMDGLSYTTIIEPAEPLAPSSVAELLRRTGRRRGSGLER